MNVGELNSLIDSIDSKLHFDQDIYDKLSVIKEIFVLYYGEEYRRLVEERFDNVSYIGYCFPGDINNLLNELFVNKSKQLIYGFFLKNGILYNDDNLVKFFNCVDVNLNNYENFNLYKIFKYISEYRKNFSCEDKVLYFLRKINENFSYDSVLKKEHIEFINEIEIDFFKMIDDFNEFKLSYFEYVDYVDKCNKLSDKINKKYMIKFLIDIEAYLSDRDRSLIKNINVLNNFDCGDLDCYGLYVGVDYKNSCLIDYFNSYNNELLNDESTPKEVIDEICKGRVSFFKKLGIDLGDNYQIYMANSECLNVMPTCYMADNISFSRENFAMKEKEEFVVSTSGYLEKLKMIEELDLLDKDISYNFLELNSYVTCINPNVRKIDDKFIRYSLLLFPLCYYSDNADHFFVHESNHLLESKLISANDKGCKFIIGWDVLETDYSLGVDLDSFFKMRKFELFSEIINDLLAQEITGLMHSLGIYLFDNKEDAKIGGSVYENVKILVWDFFQCYKKEIVDSRINGNMFVLFDKVGYYNFIKLNNLINDYGSRFFGFRKYKLDEDLANNIISEDVLFHYKCIKIRDEILNDMKLYSNKCKNKVIKYYM